MPTLPDSATALRAATNRFIAMVRDVDESQLASIVPATPDWTVRQAISHVALGAAYYADCLAGRDQWVDSPTQTAEKNTALLEIRRGVPVPTALADMAGAVDEVIDLLAALGDEPVGFHARQLLTPQGIQSMLVNEVLVHGHDVAQALRRPWKIPDDEAILALQAMTALCAAWLDPVKSAGHTASYQIRLRGRYEDIWLVFRSGKLSVGSDSPQKRADCVVYGPPSSLLLVMTGRLSPMGAFLRLKSVSWGRKPWLGLTLSRRFRSI